MAPTLLTATSQEIAQHIASEQTNKQMPLIGETGFDIADSTQSVLLEQALALLSAAEKRLAGQRKRISRLETLALTDSLTSLPNCRSFSEALLRTLAAASRYGERGAVSFVDLDNFKTVNDTLGHEAGDRVLTRLAELLSNNVRATDTVARLGGDEFVILMVRTQADEALQRARQLQALVNGSYATHGTTRIHVRASFGVVAYGAGDDAGELMQRADAAMYKDKKSRAAPRERPTTDKAAELTAPRRQHRK